VSKSTAERNREVAARLSNNLPRLLREFSRDYEQRIGAALSARGYPDIRSSHSAVLANLGMGAVRVTELAERARVTQQAMGKMLKELERMGYVIRDVDIRDKRAREIRLTERGSTLALHTAEAVDEVRRDYARRIGQPQLDELEAALRQAIGKLNLNYLPRRWQDLPPE
jgi:DNA-binding MarR family transcriptional regulator